MLIHFCFHFCFSHSWADVAPDAGASRPRSLGKCLSIPFRSVGLFEKLSLAQMCIRVRWAKLSSDS